METGLTPPAGAAVDEAVKMIESLVRKMISYEYSTRDSTARAIAASQP
jgi:hypothetical protein